MAPGAGNFLEGQELKATGIRDTGGGGHRHHPSELMMVPHLSVAETSSGIGMTSRGFIDYDQMNARATELLARLNIHDINVALPVYHHPRQAALIEIATRINKNAKLLTRRADIGSDGVRNARPSRSQ